MTDDQRGDAALLPDWETIRRDFIESGLPGRIILRANPAIEIFVEAQGRRLGASFAMPQVGALPPNPFREISVLETRADGVRHLEIATATPALYGTFYLLLEDTVRSVLETGAAAGDAFEASLSRWRALLQTSSLLADERQLGLLGELWMLERLIAAFGWTVLNAWVGPAAQSHDFRLGDVEFEVKTTSGPRRVHTINGLDQLTPTAGCSLYLVSLRFVDAGSGGETLAQTVDRILTSGDAVPGTRAAILSKLADLGYHLADSAHYSRRRRIADAARLILIEDGCPRLTPAAMAALPSGFAANLIQDVRYRVDVEALGYSDGTEPFLAVLPA